MDHPRDPTDAAVYAGLVAAGTLLFACLASQLGPLVLVVAIAAGGFALFGMLHYWLWGRRLMESGENDRDAPGASEGTREPY